METATFHIIKMPLKCSVLILTLIHFVIAGATSSHVLVFNSVLKIKAFSCGKKKKPPCLIFIFCFMRKSMYTSASTTVSSVWDVVVALHKNLNFT